MSEYRVTIKQTGVEFGTNRPIYTVETLSGEHVCNTLSWFSLDSAREHADEMSRNYLDAPIEDATAEPSGRVFLVCRDADDVMVSATTAETYTAAVELATAFLGVTGIAVVVLHDAAASLGSSVLGVMRRG